MSARPFCADFTLLHFEKKTIKNSLWEIDIAISQLQEETPQGKQTWDAIVAKISQPYEIRSKIYAIRIDRTTYFLGSSYL